MSEFSPATNMTIKPNDPMPTYPLNCWYAGALDHEVSRTPLARTIADNQVVLYRKEDGTAVALEDRCWHRLVPLSMGKLDGDNIQCPYHGLRFNPEGRCTFMPSQETINPSACIRSFPVIERHRYVWLWLGDPAQADPNLVPDLHWNNHDDWAADGKRIPVSCDYRMIVDNLMDLTHETFVHSSSIGNDAVAETPFETTHTETTATVTRWMLNIDPPPLWEAQLGRPGKVDRWQIIRFERPCTIAIDVGVAPAGTGAPEGDRSQGVNGYVLNTITPKTARSCHYFWAFARNYDIHNQRKTHELREGVAKIFGEDYVILEAQQRAFDAHPDSKFYNLNIDSGAMWARKLIDQMIAMEQGIMPGVHPAQAAE